VSSAVARACRPLGRAIEVIPNFLPLGAIAAGRRVDRPGWLPGGPYILYVGALSQDKGVPALLRAYSRLQAPPPLVLIGTAHPSVETIRQRNVIVRHDVAHDEVMCAWLGATLGSVPSVWPDPCPTTAIEAMATGTPLVASRIGGLPDIVADGKTGLLVAPGDEGGLAAALARLLDDAALRAAMGDAARERARRFDVDAIAERLERVYGAPRPLVKQAHTGELARQ
jgi:glycosyltransferase involved in cell wall biosynthesis